MARTAKAFTPPPNTSATGDVMQAHARVWRHVQCAVESCARALTRDRDEREDLIQEAHVELWRIDASRCDLRNREDLRYLRRMLTNHMCKLAALEARRQGDVKPKGDAD